MTMADIRQEFGDLPAQLLGLDYAPVRMDQLRPGELRAVESAEGWAATLIALDSRPNAETPVSIHRGDTLNTCDSVRLSRQFEGTIPTLAIEISQSLFVVAISLRAQQWPVEWMAESDEDVTRIARRFFKDSGRLSLKISKRVNGVLLGSQDMEQRLPPSSRDWRDSLQFARDAETWTFFVLKRTGFGQMVLPSFELPSNLVWFDVLERRRTAS